MNIRDLIDEAKLKAEALDGTEISVDTPNGVKTIKRKASNQSDEKQEIDKTKIVTAADGELAATLVAQLIELRATMRVLSDRDKAIKSVLQEMVGELEYLRVSDEDEPAISLKHESSVRIVASAVREMLPPEDYPDLYTQVSSRPLRLMS